MTDIQQSQEQVVEEQQYSIFKEHVEQRLTEVERRLKFLEQSLEVQKRHPNIGEPVGEGR